MTRHGANAHRTNAQLQRDDDGAFGRSFRFAVGFTGCAAIAGLFLLVYALAPGVNEPTLPPTEYPTPSDDSMWFELNAERRARMATATAAAGATATPLTVNVQVDIRWPTETPAPTPHVNPTSAPYDTCGQTYTNSSICVAPRATRPPPSPTPTLPVYTGIDVTPGARYRPQPTNAVPPPVDV